VKVLHTQDDDYLLESTILSLRSLRSLRDLNEKSSNAVIGWAWQYGKARVVKLQSGHDSPTFQNISSRKMLKKAIEWCYEG
jgi:type 1 glutamine amidotransferase